MPTIFLFSLILLFFLPPALQGAGIDSLLADNRVRAGVRAEALFAPLDTPEKAALTEVEREDYRFLLANLPLSDLASMTADDLIENIRLARQARTQFSWGRSYDEGIYRFFVLPHRMSQEPFVRYRKGFMDEIAPRVKELSAEEAILEVNHWCHEKATYRPTDGRDQDPLTTIRSGFGRCEEEMILCVAALRSVGIPARQCYTPYWAHSDDNHAWVEAYANGKWFYLGACEPAQNLNEAWFSNPARRAMLVVSTAYGEYEGSEPVLRRYGRSTNINSSAVYGKTKKLKVTVVNRTGKPAKDDRVIFSLWNYGSLMPAVGVVTDKDGVATLTCGIGDWFAGATVEEKTGLFGWGKKRTYMGFIQIKGDQSEATLKLDSEFPANWMTEGEYTPPVASTDKAPEVISAEGEARGVTSSIATPPTPPSIEGGESSGVEGRESRGVEGGEKQLADSLFRARLAWEDSVREYDLWHFAQFPWPKRGFDRSPPRRSGYIDPLRRELRNDCVVLQFSDSAYQDSINRHFNADTSCWANHTLLKDKVTGEEFDLTDYFRRARGNWPLLHHLYAASCSTNLASARKLIYGDPHFVQLRVLSNKDLFDYDASMWMDHIIYTCITIGVGAFDYRDWQDMDSAVYREIEQNLKTTRIDYEPSLPWRKEVWGFLMKDSILLHSNDAILEWLRDNIVTDPSPDRLGAPLTPAQCLELRRGTAMDIERLYIGLCRVRGIPARRNPMTGEVERWEEGRDWVAVDVTGRMEDGKGKMEQENAKGSLTIEVLEGDSLAAEALFMKDWALAKWEGSVADVQDLGWHQPYKAMSWPVELPEGWYLLSNGKRREDGSAPVKMVWMEVRAGAETTAKLEFGK